MCGREGVELSTKVASPSPQQHCCLIILTNTEAGKYFNSVPILTQAERVIIIRAQFRKYHRYHSLENIEKSSEMLLFSVLVNTWFLNAS